MFAEQTGGFRLYRIPGIVVTAKGSVLAYCEARKFTVADRGEIENAGEPNVAELPDGRVLVTARNSDPRNRRVAAYSANGATEWSPPEFLTDLLEPGCMAGLVSHPGTPEGRKPVLLFSNPHTTKRAHKDRVDVTIKLSEDGGRAWPVSKVLQPGPSGYSDVAVLPDGTILCFYESGDPHLPKKNGRRWAYSFLTVARFNLEWLMSGNDAATPVRADDERS
ncbi:MAG: exo-alpha-sialidase [Planctomycetes bacterium]|nr:exo-alpha-sialidase [Planctomycetota bacterium]